MPSPLSRSCPASDRRAVGTAIDVRALSKLHGSAPVLLDVTFAVDAGALVSLSGPAGSGKSTLLKLLAGTLSPSGGRIRLFDVDLRQARLSATALLGFVPQGRSACASMALLDVLRHAGRARRLPAAALERRIDILVDEWGLAPHLTSRCDRLGRGVQTRVDIATALLHAPRILLLDEPLAMLTSAESHEVTTRLQRQRGERTVIAATGVHPPITGCDSVLALDHGRLVSAH